MCPPFRRLVNGRGGLFEPARMVCHCLLVETPDGLTLVDTGLGTEDIRNPKGRLGQPFVALTRPVFSLDETALQQVKALGFQRSDVRHIVPTHFDLDHVGGLTDFPDATVHVLKEEHRAATERATAAERGRYRPAQFSHAVKWDLKSVAGEKWFGFDSVRAIPGTGDDVLLIPLFGHTRGHCGVAVRGDGGWILHAGDAYFAHGDVHAPERQCPPGLMLFQWITQMDASARHANQARLRELIATKGREVTVICAHDADELDAAVAKAPPFSKLAATG